jgi:hypothetical protein
MLPFLILCLTAAAAISGFQQASLPSHGGFVLNRAIVAGWIGDLVVGIVLGNWLL